MIGKPYRSYVAIGDSLSEGLGDFTFHQLRKYNGWTDRLAGILATEASDKGYEFQFANLALRGSKLEKIMETQAPRALTLQPDLITVMAGSNDLMSPHDELPRIRAIFREGILQLLASGADVVVANTINPVHLKVFKPLRYRAERMSELIESVAYELDVPVLDVYGIESFSDLGFWDKDMVHFSGHGHIKLANSAASLLKLDYRFNEFPRDLIETPARGLVETLAWIYRDVIPFTKRKLAGVTSGDGLSPKSSHLEPFQAISSPFWELVRN